MGSNALRPGPQLAMLAAAPCWAGAAGGGRGDLDGQGATASATASA